MPTRRRNPIGTHVLVGKGLVDGAVANADEVGCETFQIFVGNPRGWALSAGKPAEDARFRDLMAERGTRTFIHAPYLVNLGSPDPRDVREVGGLGRPQPQAGRRDRRRGRRRAHRLVRRPSDGDERHDAAMKQVREGLLPLLDAVADDAAPWLLLEPTAGQGRSLCAGVEDLAPYLDALDHHPKAGHLPRHLPRLRGRRAARRARAARPPPSTGSSRSAGPAGCGWCTPTTRWTCAAPSRTGTSGSARATSARARSASSSPTRRRTGVPFILETPDSRDADNRDIPLLKRLRG